ncbi:MAG TPA: citrate lyase acyl carrier protein [Tissierellaceae bacterium]|nr:citrate lyase acyl carrier protein [Tissierellaceae bacterium]
MGKVEIKKMATAGSVESNDILIMVSKGEGEVQIELESLVIQQYGENIKKVILETLKELNVEDVKLIAKDKGALDFTIRSRVKTAIKRGSGDIDEL